MSDKDLSMTMVVNVIINERLLELLHERPNLTFGQLLVAAGVAKRVSRERAEIDLQCPSEQILANIVAATGGK